MDKIFDDFLPFMEKYILADDKNAYLNSLKTDSKEKIFLELLLNDEQLFTLDESSRQKVMQKLASIGIPELILELLLVLKVQKMIQGKQNIEKMLNLLMRQGSLNENFDYPKPSMNVFYEDEQKAQDKKLQYKVDYPSTAEEFLKKKLKENQSNIADLTEYGVKCLKEEDINQLMPEWKAKLLLRQNLLCQYNQEFITKMIKDIRPHLQKSNKTYEINSQFYKYFTKKQNQKYLQTNQQLIHDREFMIFWFKQNFSERLDKFQKNSLLSVSQKEEKRLLLVQIKQATKKIPSAHMRTLTDQTLLEILILDLSLQNPKTELFIEYLSSIHTPVSHMNVGYQQRVYQQYRKNPDQGQFWNSIHGYQMSTWNQDQLIEQYLLALFKKNEDIATLVKQFQPYLQKSHLDKTAARVRLLKGEDVPNLFNILNQNEVKQLRDKKKISILSKNKKHFKICEDVVLATRVKNVKNIRIKLYQLNLEQNYLQNQTELDDNMNLTYLEPTNQCIYEVNNKNEFQQIIYDIPIKNIQKKPAVYIVELSGQGISTRAIIRKGAIVCLQKVTLAGVQLRFYDEDGKRITDLEVWINERKQKVKESYTIPFGINHKKLNIVAVKDGFAELIPIEVQAEAYNWSIGYIYNSESFIVGTKAKVVIHPRLNLYGEPLPLNLLKDTKISVGMTNSQGIKSFLSFDNIKFENNRDYILEFPLQAYTTQIIITTTSSISLYSGKKQELTDSKNIRIGLNHDSDAFMKPYLKKINGEYQLHVLGRNGQPIPNQGISLTLNTNLCGRPLQFNDAFTNMDGKIALGKLPYFNTISAKFNYSYNSQGGQNYNFICNSVSGNRCISWNLLNDNDVNFSSNLFYKKGEIIDLPLSENFDLNQLIILKMTNSNNYQQLITDSAIIENGRLKIGGLEAGTYTIRFLKSMKVSKLVILQGKQWQAANQIYVKQESNVYELVKNINQLANLGPASFEEVDEKKIAVTIPINLPEDTLSDSLRAHVLISNFYQMQCEGMFKISNFLVSKNPKKQKFKLKQCQFFNNKTLSDQENYVENRQNEKKFVGNNLEKPRIFLKRLEVRDTTQKEEELQNQGVYNPVPSDALKSRQMHLQDQLRRIDALSINYLDSHNNFIQNAAIIIGNISGNQIKFNIPKCYNNFKVLLVSHDSAIEKNYEINQQNQIEKKDLRHRGLKDKSDSEGWTMSRQSYKIASGQSIKINRNSHWCTVSLSNVAAFAEIKGNAVPVWAEKWSTFSPQKKLQTYGEKFCHEINVYCREHDQQFFEKVVKPFIANKIQKTFVDLCLLEEQSVRQFASIDKLEQLNQFQKILLIKYLISHGGNERAKQIATAMESIQKCSKKGFEEFKRQFDTVIDAKKSTEVTRNMRSGGRIQQRGNTLLEIAHERAYDMDFCDFQAENCAMQLNYASNASFDIPMQQMSYMPMQQMSYQPYLAAEQKSYQKNLQQLSFGAQRIRAAMPMRSKAMAKKAANYDNFADFAQDQMNQRNQFKKEFEQMENTKQYTETTYTNVKYSRQTKGLVPPSPFWAQLALHLANKETKPFISESFMYLGSQIQFTLAMCFLPSTINADFDMKGDEENIQIEAKSSFLIFVKEIKPTNYLKKFGVMINQRFFDPNDPYIYQDDGSQIQKEVQQFQIFKIYTSQSVITNTSGTVLELQVLLDVPQGSVPLRSHEYTQITNIILQPYSTQSFKRNFYFPQHGKFNLYPANACRGKEIISKSDTIKEIQVLKVSIKKNIQSFNDVIRMGNKDQILEFISKKNIFDTKFFQPTSILWMLKDRDSYDKVINLMRSRCFYCDQIWKFSLYHEDKIAIIQRFLIKSKTEFFSQKLGDQAIFQYFPYYSSRTHKFLNQSKSTIRNVEFKENYIRFLLSGVVKNRSQSHFKIAFVYYLLLQDRIEEASTFFNKMSQDQKKNHQLQVDYFQCFLDMYSGHPTFAKARKISAYYIDYPIEAWRNLFRQVNDIIKQFDSTTYVEEQKKVQYSTTIIEQENNFKINIPPNTKISVHFYSVNMQFYFSKFPFGEIKSMTAIKSKKEINFQAGQYRQAQVHRPQDIKDVFVEVFQCAQDKSPSKIKAWHWVNPELKIRITEKKGTAQAFFKGKQLTGCYCKVYSKNKSGTEKFYRDGYTDITGTFKYVLTGFEDITEFSILFMSEYGGITMKAKPPSTQGKLQ